MGVKNAAAMFDTKDRECSYIVCVGRWGRFFCFFVYIRTCARHLQGVGVGAIVSVAANAVNGAFTGGAAVDGALYTRLVPLSRLEEARWAS